jgi:DNA-binding response OmpR family regulator
VSVPNDKHRVLVVDEDDSLSRIVAHHLKKIGCEVLVAETGDEAMTLVDPRPTCAVLDLGKGGRVDGMRFLGFRSS